MKQFLGTVGIDDTVNNITRQFDFKLPVVNFYWFVHKPEKEQKGVPCANTTKIRKTEKKEKNGKCCKHSKETTNTTYLIIYCDIPTQSKPHTFKQAQSEQTTKKTHNDNLDDEK